MIKGIFFQSFVISWTKILIKWNFWLGLYVPWILNKSRNIPINDFARRITNEQHQHLSNSYQNFFLFILLNDLFYFWFVLSWRYFILYEVSSRSWTETPSVKDTKLLILNSNLQSFHPSNVKSNPGKSRVSELLLLAFSSSLSSLLLVQ